jgi:hypothetical protein
MSPASVLSHPPLVVVSGRGVRAPIPNGPRWLRVAGTSEDQAKERDG